MPKKTESSMKFDAMVGRYIEEARLCMGLSRDELGNSIGVSHQQLQKYERGQNRISAGRLALVAKALEQDIGYFFGAPKKRPIKLTTHRRLCVETARNFMRIKNPKHQMIVHTVAKELVGG